MFGLNGFWARVLAIAVVVALVGKAALGQAGKIIVSVAAAFSTGSAINATLFAPARPSKTVARAGYLPRSVENTTASGVPGAAVIALGAVSVTLAAIGSLGSLVEAASLIFLGTFALVNFIGARQLKDGRYRAISWAGGIAATLALLALTAREALTHPLGLTAIALVVAVSVWLRPRLPKNAN